MNRNFGSVKWREYIPIPVWEEHPEYYELYMKAWELAYDHIKDIPGMPQTPYMDEAFCETQVWIWDSCFMSFFCKYARGIFPGVETLNNFYEVLYNKYKLPELIPTVNEPAWTKAVPGMPYNMKVHIADNPPLFAWAEYENALVEGNLEYIKELLYEKRFLQKHYEWIENLNEYKTLEGVFCQTWLLAEKNGYKWEGGSSGMDNTPRGRGGAHAVEERPNNPNMLWLDAICQQALSALMISRMYALVGDKDSASYWKGKYNEKKATVNRLYWDEEDRFYYDIDCGTKEFYKVMTIASYWALTAEIATKEQAKSLLMQLKNNHTLGGFVPFVSLSRSDNDFNSNGNYWRGGVWLPTAYATLKGLANYELYSEAHELSRVLLEHMYRTYVDFEPHTIWEAYSPERYEPAISERGAGQLVRKDFCGWSALGPISILIEFVLGFHTIDAFKKIVKWEKPASLCGKIGIKNLHFGSIVTDIEAEGDKCTVVSNESYTLQINGKLYAIRAGINEFIFK